MSLQAIFSAPPSIPPPFNLSKKTSFPTQYPILVAIYQSTATFQEDHPQSLCTYSSSVCLSWMVQSRVQCSICPIIVTLAGKAYWRRVTRSHLAEARALYSVDIVGPSSLSLVNSDETQLLNRTGLYRRAWRVSTPRHTMYLDSMRSGI